MAVRLRRLGLAVGVAAFCGSVVFFALQPADDRGDDSAASSAISAGGARSAGAQGLDDFLARSEEIVRKRLRARGADIKRDQEKRVRWYGEIGKPSAVAFVYLHGFSASPLELEPTISGLADRLHANVYYARLTAHGLTDGEEFATVRLADWRRDVDEALAIGTLLGKRLIVIGCSTGAALAIDALFRRLPSSQQPAIERLVLLSPNYGVRAAGAWLLGRKVGPLVARTVVGTHREFPVENPVHGARWTTRYRAEGLAEMMKLIDVVDGLDFKKLDVPVLTLYTRRDEVVDAERIAARSREWSHPASRTIDWENGKRHQLASTAFYPEDVDDLVAAIASAL